jgi:hypothetical protein
MRVRLDLPIGTDTLWGRGGTNIAISEDDRGAEWWLSICAGV